MVRLQLLLYQVKPDKYEAVIADTKLSRLVSVKMPDRERCKSATCTVFTDGASLDRLPQLLRFIYPSEASIDYKIDIWYSL